MCRRTTASEAGPGGSTLTMSRAVNSSAAGSRPARAAASRTTAPELGTSSGESQLRIAPSPTSPATRSMPGRSAATWIGTGAATGRLSRKPSTANVSPRNTTRSPASARRRNSAISRTRAAGRAKRPPFQLSTIGWGAAPIPRQKRPGAGAGGPARPPAVPALDDRLGARADPEAEAPGRDLGEPRRGDRERRRAPGEHVGDGGADAHPGGEAHDRERREAVDAVHLERPGVGVAERLRLAGDVRELGEGEALHRDGQRPALVGHRARPPGDDAIIPAKHQRRELGRASCRERV